MNRQFIIVVFLIAIVIGVIDYIATATDWLRAWSLLRCRHIVCRVVVSIRTRVCNRIVVARVDIVSMMITIDIGVLVLVVVGAFAHRCSSCSDIIDIVIIIVVVLVVVVAVIRLFLLRCCWLCRFSWCCIRCATSISFAFILQNIKSTKSKLNKEIYHYDQRFEVAFYRWALLESENSDHWRATRFANC